MSEYTPDTWVILNLSNDKESSQKIFAGSYGGYTGGDSWKLSSGVVSEKDCGGYLEVENVSGSVYKLYKSRHGMSAYQMGILSNWQARIAEEAQTAVIAVRDEAFED